MKKNLHPTVRQVVFKDVSCDFSFLGTSTMDSKETIKWEDRKNYPLIKVEISSASHPFFTGNSVFSMRKVASIGSRKNTERSEFRRISRRDQGKLITGETLLIAGGLR
jgi:large subunit ribosomal protein L31